MKKLVNDNKFFAIDSRILNISEIMCGRCGCSFWIPIFLAHQKLQEKLTVFCPNGHESKLDEHESKLDE